MLTKKFCFMAVVKRPYLLAAFCHLVCFQVALRKFKPVCWLQCDLDQTLEGGILNPNTLKSVCQSLLFVKKPWLPKAELDVWASFCKKSNLSHPLKYILSVSSSFCNSRHNFRTPPPLFSLLDSRICCMNLNYRVLKVQVWWRNTWTIKEGRRNSYQQ